MVSTQHAPYISPSDIARVLLSTRRRLSDGCDVAPSYLTAREFGCSI